MKWHFGHKLAVIMAGLVLTASCILGYTMVYRQFSMAESQFNTTGGTLAAQLSSGAVELVFAEDRIGLSSLVKSLSNQPSVTAAAVINRDRKVLAHAGRSLPFPAARIDSAYQSKGSFTDDNGTVWFHAPVIFKQVSGGAAWVGLDKTELTATQKSVIRSGIIVVTMLVLSVSLIALRLGRSLGRPIHDLIEGTRAIESAQYDFRINGRHTGEFRALTRAFNNMAGGLEQKIRVERLFSRFVSNPVAARYMARDNIEIGKEGKKVDASVIFVDLVGYTAFSEGRPPEEVAEILNLYFTEFADACHQYNGNVDKYIGDCAMLIFGCPQHDPDHRYHAMMCAIRIRSRIFRLNQRRKKAGLPCLDIRIGISGGTVLAGLFGSHERLQYTVIGEGANLASRLCDLAKPGQIMTDAAFYAALTSGHPLTAHDARSISVKGFREAVEALVIGDWQPVVKPATTKPPLYMCSPLENEIS
ncbi:MAG: adenylate/guanylate cyclase domain-containing protein [Desulfosalsimonadaceae bacterium]